MDGQLVILRKKCGDRSDTEEKQVSYRDKITWKYFEFSDKGYYKYDPKTHKKEVDMEMEQLIEKFSKQSRPNIQILSDQVSQKYRITEWWFCSGCRKFPIVSDVQWRSIVYWRRNYWSWKSDWYHVVSDVWKDTSVSISSFSFL